MAPLEIKSALKESLSGLFRQMNSWNRSRYSTPDEINGIKNTVYSLTAIVDRLLDIIEVPLDTSKEQLQLNPAPFQPECRCIVGRQNDNSVAIYHCDYHRSIDFIHNSLKALLIDISMETSENKLRETIRADIAFLDRCKEKSLTGKVGKKLKMKTWGGKNASL